MREEPSVEGSWSLCTLASDPSRLEALYEELRDFCHTFRNRLNLIQMSLYLARKSEKGCTGRWDNLDGQYRAVERLMDQFQALCRPMPLLPVTMDLSHLLNDRFPVWSSWLGTTGIGLEIYPPPAPVVVDFDPSRLGQGLDALARWRAEEAPGGSVVRVSWANSGSRTQLRWEELAPADPRPEPMTILPLALLTRVISAHRGTIELKEHTGFRIEMTWPVALGPGSGEPAQAPGRSRGDDRRMSLGPMTPTVAGH